jgi:hypothetical protein
MPGRSWVAGIDIAVYISFALLGILGSEAGPSPLRARFRPA